MLFIVAVNTKSYSVYLQMRQNIGIALVASTPGVPVTAASVPEEQELVPPMQMLTPWAFKVCLTAYVYVSSSCLTLDF